MSETPPKNPVSALELCDYVSVAVAGGSDTVELLIDSMDAIDLIREHPDQFTVVYYPATFDGDLEPRAPGGPRLRIETREGPSA